MTGLKPEPTMNITPSRSVSLRTRPHATLATALALAAGLTVLSPMLTPTPTSAQPQIQLQSTPETNLPRYTLLTASGFGEAARAPDRAVVTVGVTITEKTATLATDALNRRIDAATRAIKATNLPGMVVQTQWVSVSPQFNYQDQAEGREPKVVGYVASTTLRVQLDDPASAGKVIDAAVASGGNTVQGVSFELVKRDDAEGEALAQATATARRRAEVMARALGLKITRVIEAKTGTSQGHAPVWGMEKMAMSTRAGAPTNVEIGEITVSADATISFAAEPGR
jgi:hypothetical protein